MEGNCFLRGKKQGTNKNYLELRQKEVNLRQCGAVEKACLLSSASAAFRQLCEHDLEEILQRFTRYLHDSIQCGAWHTESAWANFLHLPQRVSQMLLYLWLGLTQLEWLPRGLQSVSMLSISSVVQFHPRAT